MVGPGWLNELGRWIT